MHIKSMVRLLVMSALIVPITARALPLTLSLDGLFLSGIGVCTNAPGGCTDPQIPVGINQNIGEPGFGLPYDQVQLTATSFNFDSLNGPFTFLQPYVFFPGDTGAGSVGFLDLINLARNVMLSDGNAYSQTLVLAQTGSILVGQTEDTLTFNPSAPLMFTNVPGVGNLVLTLGGDSVTAGIDPPGDLEGSVVVQANAPIPGTMALFSIGLALAGFARRRAPRLA